MTEPIERAFPQPQPRPRPAPVLSAIAARVNGDGNPLDRLELGDNRPIGVFDSGVGGLTVLRAIRDRMPNESTLYVGDLAHFPYGPRPQEEVKKFAFDIIRYLEDCHAKMIVIACNTATAAALEQARGAFKVPIIGVINPAAEAAASATENQRVAIVSTEGTRQSGKFPQAIHVLRPNVEIMQKACPSLVQLVESGRVFSSETDATLRHELSDVVNQGADTLVLACTHFPVLGSAIQRLFPGRFKLVDSAQATATAVEEALDTAGMRASPSRMPSHEVRVTADPSRFVEVASRVLGEKIATPRTVQVAT